MLLLELLLDTLKVTSKRKDAAAARIVFVASLAHQKLGSKAFTYKDLDVINNEKPGVWGHYGQSKLANIYCGRKYASLLASEKIFVNIYHPGMTDSGKACVETPLCYHVLTYMKGLWSGPALGRNSIVAGITNMVTWLVSKMIFNSIDEGIAPGEFLATSEEIVSEDIR